MLETAPDTSYLAQERRLKKQRRIGELHEKLRQKAADHIDLLEEKDLLSGPVLTGSTFMDIDVNKSREEIWKTAGELLRLDNDALTCPSLIDTEG